LALSVSGLYGVLTYNVNERRREIGIRMTLGATAGIVVRLVMRQMIRLAVFGTAIGLALAFTALRTLNSATAFATASMLDVPAVIAGLSVVLAATAIASFYPARRATRVDPATTLRADA
jgi:ABC-type antimicrobial peptide transport system permease subunit